MSLLRFLLSLFAFIGALAAAATLVLSLILMIRFPPLLAVVALACWVLCKLLKALKTPSKNPNRGTKD